MKGKGHSTGLFEKTWRWKGFSNRDSLATPFWIISSKIIIKPYVQIQWVTSRNLFNLPILQHFKTNWSNWKSGVHWLRFFDWWMQIAEQFPKTMHKQAVYRKLVPLQALGWIAIAFLQDVPRASPLLYTTAGDAVAIILLCDTFLLLPELQSGQEQS